MTLLELCDPALDYVCFVNRSARRGAHIDAETADSELERIFSDMRSRAASTPGLADLYDKIEWPLMCFVDNVISGSPFAFAESYQRLAYKHYKDVMGDTTFCEAVQNTLAETESVSSNERLAVLFTCIGLGFVGDALADPEARKKLSYKIAARIRPLMETQEDRSAANRITPQAYQHTIEDDLVPPPVKPVWAFGIALAGFVLAVVVSMAYLYQRDTKEVNSTLNTLVSEGAQ